MRTIFGRDNTPKSHLSEDRFQDSKELAQCCALGQVAPLTNIEGVRDSVEDNGRTSIRLCSHQLGLTLSTVRRSCDLTPFGCFLWGYLLSLVYGNNPQTIQVLKEEVIRVTNVINPEVCEK